MSKPTDLDELMRLQREEEELERAMAAQQNQNLGKMIPSPNSPLYQNTEEVKAAETEQVYQNAKETATKKKSNDVSMDTTQEIDIDAIIGLPGDEYNAADQPDNQEAAEVEKIVWPTKDETSAAALAEPVEMHPDFVKDHLAMCEPNTFLYGSRVSIQKNAVEKILKKKQIK